MGRSVSERSVSERSVSERSVSERNINAPSCESQQKLELRSTLCAQLCALSSVRSTLCAAAACSHRQGGKDHTTDKKKSAQSAMMAPCDPNGPTPAPEMNKNISQ